MGSRYVSVAWLTRFAKCTGTHGLGSVRSSPRLPGFPVHATQPPRTAAVRLLSPAATRRAVRPKTKGYWCGRATCATAHVTRQHLFTLSGEVGESQLHETTRLPGSVVVVVISVLPAPQPERHTSSASSDAPRTPPRRTPPQPRPCFFLPFSCTRKRKKNSSHKNMSLR
jgi:hypothetical protein